MDIWYVLNKKKPWGKRRSFSSYPIDSSFAIYVLWLLNNISHRRSLSFCSLFSESWKVKPCKVFIHNNIKHIFHLFFSFLFSLMCVPYGTKRNLFRFLNDDICRTTTSKIISLTKGEHILLLARRNDMVVSIV